MDECPVKGCPNPAEVAQYFLGPENESVEIKVCGWHYGLHCLFQHEEGTDG